MTPRLACMLLFSCLVVTACAAAPAQVTSFDLSATVPELFPERFEGIESALREGSIHTARIYIRPLRLGSPSGLADPASIRTRGYFLCDHILDQPAAIVLADMLRDTEVLSYEYYPDVSSGIDFLGEDDAVLGALFMSREYTGEIVVASIGDATAQIDPTLSRWIGALYPEQVNLANPRIAPVDPRCEATEANPFW